METKESMLDAEVRRIMSLDLPLNERRRMAADVYCDAYNINPAGLIRVLFKPDALSVVARLMHMQLDNVTDSPRWGMVYHACKKSGAFVAMNPASFIRAVQSSLGASLNDGKSMVSAKTIEHGISTMDILLTKNEEKLTTKDKELITAMEFLAKQMSESC